MEDPVQRIQGTQQDAPVQLEVLRAAEMIVTVRGGARHQRPLYDRNELAFHTMNPVDTDSSFPQHPRWNKWIFGAVCWGSLLSAGLHFTKTEIGYSVGSGFELIDDYQISTKLLPAGFSEGSMHNTNVDRWKITHWLKGRMRNDPVCGWLISSQVLGSRTEKSGGHSSSLIQTLISNSKTRKSASL